MSITHLSQEESLARANAARARMCASDPAKCPKSKPVARVPEYNSGIGDRLAQKFGEYWAKSSSTCSCNQLLTRLNTMTADEALDSLPLLVDRIEENIPHLTGVGGIAIQAAHRMFPARVRAKIESLVRKAIAGE